MPQVFLPHEQLQQQFCDKVHQQLYNCMLRNASVENVVPDPDLPNGCDANSPEYDFLKLRYKLRLILSLISF